MIFVFTNFEETFKLCMIYHKCVNLNSFEWSNVYIVGRNHWKLYHVNTNYEYKLFPLEPCHMILIKCLYILKVHHWKYEYNMITMLLINYKLNLYIVWYIIHILHLLLLPGTVISPAGWDLPLSYSRVNFSCMTVINEFFLFLFSSLLSPFLFISGISLLYD